MLNAERMLNKAKSNQVVISSMGYPAVLTKDVQYVRIDGLTMNLSAGDEIYVDIAKGLACAGDDYFDIDDSEFRLTFQN